MDLTNLHRDKKNSRTINPDLSTMIYGKVPPQAREMEEAILGAIMLEKEAYDKVVEILKPEMFYVDGHKRIFTAMGTLANRSQPIDVLTLTEQLRISEELDLIGGPYYLTKLTNSVVSGANVQAHAEVVYQKFIKREQIRICGETIQEAYEDSSDPYDSLDQFQLKVNNLATQNIKAEVSPIADLLVERFQRIEELRHREDHLTGVPSGFKLLDLLTAGFQDTDLIIVAARPSVGKTAFALNIARNASEHKTKKKQQSPFFSLEMSKGQITERLMSAESGINLDLITRAKMDNDAMERLYKSGLQPLAQTNMFIDDTPAMNIFELKAKCRKLKKESNIGLVIVDYLQLMSGISEDKKQSNREQEIANISRSLKALAKELKVPVIALSQLSRDIEKQKRDPQLSDLRESGAIEQDADMVMFLTRPDYQEFSERGGEGDAVKGMADIHIKKHRNGDLAKIPMRTVLEIQRWMDNDQYEMYMRNLSGFRPIVKPVNNHYERNDDNPF